MSVALWSIKRPIYHFTSSSQQTGVKQALALWVDYSRAVVFAKPDQRQSWGHKPGPLIQGQHSGHLTVPQGRYSHQYLNDPTVGMRVWGFFSLKQECFKIKQKNFSCKKTGGERKKKGWGSSGETDTVKSNCLETWRQSDSQQWCLPELTALPCCFSPRSPPDLQSGVSA